MEQKTSAIVMKGKPVAEKMTEGLVAEIESLSGKAGRQPGLAVVLVGEDPASQVYVRIKGRTAAKLGIETYDHRIPEDTPQAELISLIESLNADPKVDGILIQLPLPPGLNEQEALRTVALDKDVDVFHPENFGRLALKQGILRPCTPAGVIEILKHYDINIEGKKVALIGRSKIVGLPLSLMMIHENATVTVCHSRTGDIPAVTREADIVVAALGRPKFLTADMVKEGAVVVDVGINRVDEKLVGDCDFDALVDKVSAITPVPGGVGPMTVAMLMANTVRAFREHVAG
ncbi:MAG: bifunctional methylenetetrahydrofolate dehydrogenase/methenyltetrahydrofolate cyclohydrolase FolD [Nitrospinaceae bacterium]|jgi:methylenetetrahydrofolate dehydrogenase (NADP+) / methenyltetrahydrofolate cyclohydrolase|nr:bifunctional methylenetetrahydrofolate dehydrogenase/methenyltetrahydrofolate cyclohydrolase FolD [Nitrospinaceae bacterium]MBT3432960.1 bifunctional methylenetetrahydrofolate dehydrogenase/methenyltetrahydrofolate cyclohydrolase FolD [Nitrospinaceae bacterium]MBT3822770.1 bifunctional methylenetetrahydrofolate dehydrogenase/methenyltetrahydrofolate cyclohydrolase FolD [Nitrospinaceae bacterium]MBT4095292.1 bifunctional methylenetetrahydrofolate dehydrogenase/methenyltetrahydrofolate cyclohyd